MARISVIVPTFNRVGYLREAIASILSQDYGDFELVVADNASTDGTAELLAAVTDPRLRHVRRAHNIGWRANFNDALHGADSELVVLIGDDDRLLPGALTRAVRLLDEAPAVGFVHTTFHCIDDHGAALRSDDTWSIGPVEDRVERGADFILGSMRALNQVCLSSAVMRTAALPEVCFEAVDGERGDVTLLLRVALDWDVGFLATPGVELREHPEQLSSAFDEITTLTTVYDMKLRFLSNNETRLEHVGALRGTVRAYTAKATMGLSVSMAARKSRAEGVQTLRRAIRLRPQLLLAPRTWLVAVKLTVGPRMLRRLRGLRTRWWRPDDRFHRQ